MDYELMDQWLDIVLVSGSMPNGDMVSRLVVGVILGY
jgi:hypothetical protein